VPDDGFKNDVAFSFLGQDEPLARRLYDLVATRVRSFIYSDAERQARLAGADGGVAFANVYAHEARTVVVLYRAGWGDTGFTAVEATAIRNRAYQHGFEFVTFIPLDTPPVVPPWLPRTRLWFDLERYGEAVAAAVIESRVQEAGGVTREETAIEIMARQRREQQLASTKAGVLDSRRSSGLGPLLREIRGALADIAEHSGGLMTLTDPASHVVGLTTPYYLSVDFALQQATLRTERDGDLIVNVWHGSLGEYGPGPLFREQFALDLLGPDLFGWRSLRKSDAPVLGQKAFADWGVKRLLEYVERERAKGR
jgi:hypothetical protein